MGKGRLRGEHGDADHAVYLSGFQPFRDGVSKAATLVWIGWGRRRPSEIVDMLKAGTITVDQSKEDLKAKGNREKTRCSAENIKQAGGTR